MSAAVFGSVVSVLLGVALIPALAWMVARRGRWLLAVSVVGMCGQAVLVVVDSSPWWVSLPFVVGAAAVAWLWRGEGQEAQAAA